MENMNPAPATAAHPAAILAIILASYFMILLDNSVIFTALPSLQADLQLGTGELSWVQDAYTLVFGGLLLLGARAGDRRARRFDLFGALSATLGVGALVFGIINTADAGWASPATGTAVTAGIVLLVVFVLIERRAAQPIMPLRLFASRRRAHHGQCPPAPGPGCHRGPRSCPLIWPPAAPGHPRGRPEPLARPPADLSTSEKGVLTCPPTIPHT